MEEKTQAPRGVRRRTVLTAAPASVAVTIGTSQMTAASAAPPAPASTVDVVLKVNGVDHRLTVDSRTTLLDALRERLELKHLEFSLGLSCRSVKDGPLRSRPEVPRVVSVAGAYPFAKR